MVFSRESTYAPGCVLLPYSLRVEFNPGNCGGWGALIAYLEWTDQPTDAKLLVDVFKIGVRMRNEEDGTLSIQQVQRCIDEATQGLNATQMKKRAVALKVAAKKALEDGGSSDANINLFINEITGK